MTEDQGDDMLSLLRELIVEVTALRTEFQEFTGYNVHNMAALQDALTGPLGYHMGDLHEKMGDVVSGLAAVESTIDLK